MIAALIFLPVASADSLTLTKIHFYVYVELQRRTFYQQNKKPLASPGEEMETINKLADLCNSLLRGHVSRLDLQTTIGEGITLEDVIRNHDDPLPEYLEIDEVFILWGYLPLDRRSELTQHIERFIDSVPKTNRPSNDYAAWKKFYSEANLNSFEEKLATLQLVRLAEKYREWLFVSNIAQHDSIKIIAVVMMRELAETPLESSIAARKANDINISSS
jgi:hypothetical protein